MDFSSTALPSGISVTVGTPPGSAVTTTPAGKKQPAAAIPVDDDDVLSQGWSSYDPTASEQLQEVLYLLGGDLSISATMFGGRIMAAIRHNRIEFLEDEHGISQEQYIPQKGMGVYLNIEGNNGWTRK